MCVCVCAISRYTIVLTQAPSLLPSVLPSLLSYIVLLEAVADSTISDPAALAAPLSYFVAGCAIGIAYAVKVCM